MNHDPVSFAKIYIARNEVRDSQVGITVGIQGLLTRMLADNPQLSHIVIQEVNSNDWNLYQWKSWLSMTWQMAGILLPDVRQ